MIGVGLMGKLKSLTKGRERQISQAVDKAGDVVDKKTQGKYSGHIQTVGDKVDDALGVEDDQALGVRDDRTPSVDRDPPAPTRPAV